MRTIAMTLSLGACAVAALVTSACGSDTAPGSPRPTVSAVTGQEEAEPAPPADEEWTMPNLVGATLQVAQDEIQALTGGAVYFTDSHDLSGEGRNQVRDANWQVCTQNVEPGAPLTTASRVDFGVVKVDESCP